MRHEKPSRDHWHQRAATKSSLVALLLFIVGIAKATTCAIPETISDGWFRTPAVSAGSLQMLPSGSAVGSWTVLGNSGEIALLGKSYSEGGFSISDAGDAQVMNLAFGGGGAAAGGGISRVVATRPGAEYDLYFSVGNLVDTTGSLGTASTVSLKIDGAETGNYSNTLGTGSSSVDWESFDVHFQATSASTTIEFRNLDPLNDHANFLAFVQMFEAGAPDCGGGGGASHYFWLLTMIPLFMRRYAFTKWRWRASA